MIGISFSICCFIFLLILLVFYFSKKRLNNMNNKLFTILMIINIIGIFIDVGGFASFKFLGVKNPINILISKIYLIYYLTYIFCFMLYIYNVSTKLLQKIFNKSMIVFLIISVIIYFLPIEIHFENNIGYTYGLSVNVAYAVASIMIVIMLYFLLKNIKNIGYKEYIPLFAFIVLTITTIIIQKVNPEITMLLLSNTIVTYLMYFTIENPDMKLLEESYKAKEISDNANEEKTLFLYNMTQEIRNTINQINNDTDIILDSKDFEEIYDSARDIKAKSNAFVSATNDILDMSYVDASTIKVYNEKYNIKLLLRQIVNVYGDICKNKELKFNTNIDHDIPDSLYGDGISLKEVLNTILSNSVKYTNKGFIELSVNTIVKGDICRLIFTIEDSGNGIKSEDINKIKVDNKSLAKAYKTITLMNGTMLISSDYGIGTKVKIILDQKIGEVEVSEVSKYESNFDNISILCVDDSESGLKIIEKLLKGTNIKLDLANTGKECLDKLKIGKYDLVLLDEELSQISGLELIKKIYEIRNFKTPVILLTKSNSYEYNEEYLKLGFSDYLLKPLKKEELLKKIDKYVKEDNK